MVDEIWKILNISGSEKKEGGFLMENHLFPYISMDDLGLPLPEMI